MQRYSRGSLDTIPGSRGIGVGLGQPSDPIACMAIPDRLARGRQVFTGPTLSVINNTIVGRSGDLRPVVYESSGSMMEKSP